MSKARKVLDLLEVVSFTRMGPLQAKSVEQQFTDKLTDTFVKVALTPHEGIFVYFQNPMGQKAVMLFDQHPDGIPSVRVMPYGSNDFFTKDLSYLSPPVLLPFMVPDLFNLGWFPGADIQALLDQPGPAEEAIASRREIDITTKIGKSLGIAL